MPQVHLSGPQLLALLPDGVSREQIIDLLFTSKTELHHWEGDEISIEATPDRLDLLDEGGLAFHLQGVLGSSLGLPLIPRQPSRAELTIRVDPAVAPLRPEIAAAVVVPPPGRTLESALLEEAIRFQELLHATVGQDRRAASIGIYPLDRVDPPVEYTLQPLETIRFVPLDRTESMVGREFFASHPMAARYGPYGRVDGNALVLRDQAGEVLSLPPVLNSRGAGEARAGDGELLLESTGTRAARVTDCIGLMILPFVARGWSVVPVRIDATGSRASDGLAALAPRSVLLRSVELAAIAGDAYPSDRVVHWTRVARLGIEPVPLGYRVDVPPWRPDVLGEVDVIEDVLLARGVRSEDGLVAPSTTRGRWLEENRFRRRAGELLLGLGYTELYTSVLVSTESVSRLADSRAIALANPTSEQYSHLRDRLLLPLLDVLGRNTRHGYPQRFYEVGPVLVPERGAVSGATTRYRAGALLASERAGFADVAAVAEYLVRSFGAGGVREPAELPGVIPGRGARLKVAGEAIAELGEVHPAILASLGVPVPAAYAEIDLTALWPLVRRPQTD